MNKMTLYILKSPRIRPFIKKLWPVFQKKCCNICFNYHIIKFYEQIQINRMFKILFQKSVYQAKNIFTPREFEIWIPTRFHAEINSKKKYNLFLSENNIYERGEIIKNKHLKTLI